MKRHSILFSFLGVLALSAFNGCGDDTKAPDPDKYPGFGQFCNAIAEVECTAAVVENCSLPNREICISSVQNDCANGGTDLTKNFTVNSDTYDPKKAEPCVAAVQAAFGDAKLDGTDLGNIEKACAPAFSAKAAVGFQCKTDFDCTGGNLKCFYGSDGIGVCRVAVPVEGGSNCDQDGSVCPSGKYCFLSSDAGVGRICKDKEATGAICGLGTRECADGNFCQLAKDASGTLTKDGVCVAKFAAGTECAADQECSTGRCGVVNTANGPVGKCLTNIIFSASEPYCDNFKPAPTP